jgi:GTP-binding protein
VTQGGESRPATRCGCWHDRPALPPGRPTPTPSEEAGRKLFAGPVEFVKGVVAMDGLPPADRLEVCFAGRSNVGKSSLINALTGRKALARTSNTPGRTQEINFFDLGGRAYLVDLPGYGFAEAPKPVVARWQALLKAYLAGRPTLRRAFVLIDMRHGVKAVDHEIMALLDRAAVTFQVVLTKADKIGAPRRKRRWRRCARRCPPPRGLPELICHLVGKGRGYRHLARRSSPRWTEP